MSKDLLAPNRAQKQAQLKWAILGALAEYGSLNIEEVAEKANEVQRQLRSTGSKAKGSRGLKSIVPQKVNYSTIYRNVKALESSLLLIKVKEYQRRGIHVSDYDLTGIGLLKVLSYSPFLKKFEKIGRSHVEKLPLLFGKFSHFKASGILDDVIDLTHFFCGHRRDDLFERYEDLVKYFLVTDSPEDHTMTEEKNEIAASSIGLLRKVLYENVLLWPVFNPNMELDENTALDKLDLSFPRTSAGEWFRTLLLDRDLREYLLKYVEKSEQRLSRLRRFIR